MWKDYSVSYMKNNRSSSVSTIVASLIATLFLSLLCSLFFNIWTYEIEQITLDEGDWHGRIVGEISDDDLSLIQNFANVERAVINEELSEDEGTVVDVYFENMRTIYEDMPLIEKQLGLKENAIHYHSLLLSRYMIHDPQDEEPPLLIAFYLVVLIIVSFSLILIIRNSFAVSMNARIHQFGIFSSIGATPKQIRSCLMQEAAALCALPIIVGSVLGIVISFGFIKVLNILGAEAMGRHEVVFQYHPLVLVITILSAALTVLLSAWMPAIRLSKLTPLEAIRNAGGLKLKRKKRSRTLSALFGMEGELAGNALKLQKKSLRTSTLSLILSFLGFTMMMCFFSLSGISTQMTYYDKYENVWDVMVTVKNTDIEDFKLTEELQELQGVQDCIVYQKETKLVSITKEWQSEEVIELGGLETIAGKSIPEENGNYQVKSSMVILDDASFEEYCKQIGIAPDLNGAIILNKIWDRINSNFRNPKYIPFVKENQTTSTLYGTNKQEQSAKIPILGYTKESPILREEYSNYTLVHFIPLSLWKQISSQIGADELDIYIKALAKERTSLDNLNELEDEITKLAGKEYEIESENRIQEKISDDDMKKGLMLILGAFCSLLAFIGIANVFSNTLGFLRQRKREFAQYMSVGMTPSGMRKMFCVEALVIAGRPLLITLPLTVAFVIFAVNASHLDISVFMEEAPILPIAAFSLAIFFFVAIAYYIGGKRILQCDLSEALRNDTMI